jgi:hypothetical protein
MEVSEAIKARRSIRLYKPDKVSSELIKMVLFAGHMAPSAGNLQGREFVVITDKKTKDALCSAALGQEFISEAPACIVVCANIFRSARKYGKRAELYAVQDASISMMIMMLMAHDLGLGTCWVGAFSEQEVIKILGLPDGVRPVGIMPLGYPDEKPEAPPRLGEKIEHWGSW